MKLVELEDAFRVEADDVEEPHLWPHDEFVASLNEAQEEACIRSKLIHEKSDPTICEIVISASEGSVYAVHELVHEIFYASIKNEAGEISELDILDREELDRTNPEWRTETRKPTAIIHYDNHIETDCLVDGTYTIHLEVYRLPLKPLVEDNDCPEINRMHHRRLIDWVLYRAYEKPDADTLNPAKAQKALERFEEYFGTRPNAKLRKDVNANRPHRNKAYW